MVSPRINFLSEQTIDRIAAGEVVERPSSVAKELVENSLDAGATRVVVELKNGGIDLLRVTDDGCGILSEELPHAFLRHTTSKIATESDLCAIKSLGFRGEALSSIVAVSHLECITKTEGEVMGSRCLPDASGEARITPVGAPNGTTFIVRDLFYNTPARYKFLKSPKTEGSYIVSLIEKLALSRPDVAFSLIVDGRVRISTTGNGSLKDAVYSLYGRDMAAELIELDERNQLFAVRGFLGKPVLSRGNRSFEIIFANGRYVKSKMLADAVLAGYHGLLMGHQFPFYVLFFEFPSDKLDVNVHPAKTEVRISGEWEVCLATQKLVEEALRHKDYAVFTKIGDELEGAGEPEPSHTEPFETRRIEALREAVKKDSPYEKKYENIDDKNGNVNVENENVNDEGGNVNDEKSPGPEVYEQIRLSDDGIFAKEENRAKYTLVGQIFETYWIIQFEDRMFLMDQHAAHEKVLYERTMAALRSRTVTSQQLLAPVILSLSAEEADVLSRYKDVLNSFGYEFEPFGDRDIRITAVPANLFEIDVNQVFHGFLGQLSKERTGLLPEVILDKLARMSCKAAVKGGHSLSPAEARALMEELFSLEDPYHCPHGRPTLIVMTKTELEKKFKRIVG